MFTGVGERKEIISPSSEAQSQIHIQTGRHEHRDGSNYIHTIILYHSTHWSVNYSRFDCAVRGEKNKVSEGKHRGREREREVQAY